MKSSPEASTRNYKVKKGHVDGAALDGEPVRANARHFYGFSPIPAGGAPVTNEMVDKLRDQLGI